MNTTTEPTTTAPATLAEAPVLAMLARGGWITKTARNDGLPDPWFVTADRFDLTFYLTSYDDLIAWAGWAGFDIGSSVADASGNTHYVADGVLWDIPLHLLFIDRSTTTAVA